MHVRPNAAARRHHCPWTLIHTHTHTHTSPKAYPFPILHTGQVPIAGYRKDAHRRLSQSRQQHADYWVERSAVEIFENSGLHEGDFSMCKIRD